MSIVESAVGRAKKNSPETPERPEVGGIARPQDAIGLDSSARVRMPQSAL